MPTVMRPWTVRLLELVDEGVTEIEELIQRATSSVPIGHAFRMRETRNAIERARHQRRHPGARVILKPTRSAIEIHRVGARHVLRGAIHTLIRQGHLVRDGANVRRPSQATRTAPRPERTTS